MTRLTKQAAARRLHKLASVAKIVKYSRAIEKLAASKEAAWSDWLPWNWWRGSKEPDTYANKGTPSNPVNNAVPQNAMTHSDPRAVQTVNWLGIFTGQDRGRQGSRGDAFNRALNGGPGLGTDSNTNKKRP